MRASWCLYVAAKPVAGREEAGGVLGSLEVVEMCLHVNEYFLEQNRYLLVLLHVRLVWRVVNVGEVKVGLRCSSEIVEYSV